MAPRGWIAVHRDVANSMLVGHGVAELDVPAPHVVGLLVNFWARLHEADRDGRIESVPDTMLDQWAGWSGKPLAFARFVRKYHVDASGRVKGWDEWQSGEAHAKQQATLRQARHRSRHANVTSKRDLRNSTECDAGHAGVTTNGLTHSRTDGLTNQAGTPPPDWRARKDLEAADAVAIPEIKRAIAEHGGPMAITADKFAAIFTAEQKAVISRKGGIPAVWGAP